MSATQIITMYNCHVAKMMLQGCKPLSYHRYLDIVINKIGV